MSAWSRITETRAKFLFFPVTIFYWGVIFWRNIFYNFNFFVSRRVPAKVISIGNITAGGTGKTPAVIYLSNLLKNNNYKVAVLSRGYGRKTAGTQLVSDGKNKDIDWRNFGDEPALIAKKLSNVPVVVDQNRYRGATYIVEKFKPDIIILDDAFQHRSLERDLDVVLLNSQAPISDYKLIPHGLLREPLSHLKRADIIIFTKSNSLEPHRKILNVAKKTDKPIFYSLVNSTGFSSGDSTLFEPKHNTKAVAVSAIADPQSFYKSLDGAGINVIEKIAFFDHYEFKQTDIDRFKKTLEESGADLIVTTEKDFVRFSGLNLYGLTVCTLNIEFCLDDTGENYIKNFFKLNLSN